MWGRITGNTGGESKTAEANNTSGATKVDNTKPGAFATKACGTSCGIAGHGHSTISSADKKKN